MTQYSRCHEPFQSCSTFCETSIKGTFDYGYSGSKKKFFPTIITPKNQLNLPKKYQKALKKHKTPCNPQSKRHQKTPIYFQHQAILITAPQAVFSTFEITLKTLKQTPKEV